MEFIADPDHGELVEYFDQYFHLVRDGATWIYIPMVDELLSLVNLTKCFDHGEGWFYVQAQPKNKQVEDVLKKIVRARLTSQIIGIVFRILQTFRYH